MNMQTFLAAIDDIGAVFLLFHFWLLMHTVTPYHVVLWFIPSMLLYIRCVFQYEAWCIASHSYCVVNSFPTHYYTCIHTGLSESATFGATCIPQHWKWIDESRKLFSVGSCLSRAGTVLCFIVQSPTVLFCISCSSFELYFKVLS